MGADLVEDRLRPLLRAVQRAEHPVVWACDPMHANTFVTTAGTKTRHLEDIVREIGGFFRAHRAEGTQPAGLHVELTGEDVTECLGGAEEILDEHLTERYETVLDPRLNGRQSIDLAFRVAELLREA
jgi:3-deoxy-7-phosphoheptulonate synthase